MITAKFGRNELCPCGSEKKFKKCCSSKLEQRTFCAAQINTTRVTQIEALETSLAETLDSFLGFLLYASTKENREIDFPASIESTFLADFINKDLIKKEYLELNDESLIGAVFRKYFFHWLYFFWKPQCKDGSSYKENFTLLEIYVKGGFAKNASELHHRFIEATKSAYYSFYEIIEVIPGKKITAQDLFLGNTVTFLHTPLVIGSLTQGMIVFLQIITVDGLTKAFGIGPVVVAVPTDDEGLALVKKNLDGLVTILTTEKQGALTAQDLLVNDTLMRTFFFRILQQQIDAENARFNQENKTKVSADSESLPASPGE